MPPATSPASGSFRMMQCQGNSDFRSADRRFGLIISKSRLAQLYARCATAHPMETGGVLIGRYNARRDTAIVALASGPPPDSKNERSRFYRGTLGLNALLEHWWAKQQYYLGEWHYHPDGVAVPSAADIKQMQKIASDNAARCPEPVLLIIGGGPVTTAHVFPRDEAAVQLNLVVAAHLPGGPK